ncbi:hypothetical protein P1X14_03315 [Sphingomonas sp. AOB5]|uniref:hypothetical protein n=1 Tax=Sphingomonas sp. AOB5 TaxID=3034017 RepID=UPI0023F90D65|nr:hypothetical protein [Sphingomonas sp. AOB5]MDF7774267.1 hypothetical protein [Sphingomonas sp. AOB5]
MLNALAAEFPKLHSEQSLLDCASLLAAYDKTPSEKLTDNERRAVAKVLRRLVEDGGVRETLWLNGRDPRVNLENAGLVAVAVDIATLRQEEWIRTNSGDHNHSAHQGPSLAPGQPATQETIMDLIIERTKEWSEVNRLDSRLPLALTNIAIVHGAVDYDILINLSFVDQEYLLKYAREVVQRIPHVRATQTMLLSSESGFSRP